MRELDSNNTHSPVVYVAMTTISIGGKKAALKARSSGERIAVKLGLNPEYTTIWIFFCRIDIRVFSVRIWTFAHAPTPLTLTHTSLHTQRLAPPCLFLFHSACIIQGQTDIVSALLTFSVKVTQKNTTLRFFHHSTILFSTTAGEPRVKTT